MNVDIYFDFDNVLTVKDPADYNTDEHTGRHLVDASHYYRTAKPNDKMINVFSHLQRVTESYEFNVRCNVISTLPRKGSLFMEQYNDKLAWLRDRFNNFSKKNFCAVPFENKYLPFWVTNMEHLNFNSILIDSLSNNLVTWQESHGPAFKYCSGNETCDDWYGVTLDPDMSSDDIVRILLATSQTICNLKRE